MGRFKPIQQNYLFRKLLQYWGNIIANYNGICFDNDFFDVMRNCFDHEKAVELIEAAYTTKEMASLTNQKLSGNKLDLKEPLDQVFEVLWNRDWARKKCRIVLSAAREFMELEATSGKNDVVARRFAELVTVLHLSPLEAEILTLVYVLDQTFLCFPVHVNDRDKPLYYAMALDKSYHEVAAALTSRGKLLRLGMLDRDFDFNRRAPLAGFMDGTSDEPVERRFYTVGECKDVLPWEFFGELAEKDGEVLKRMVPRGAGKCNILLYGAPGTGKTSFARALAGELGRTAFEIRQGDEDGKNMNAEARMVGIQVCNDQEAPEGGIMLVDEADELLRGSSRMGLFGFDFGGGKSTEKGVMNSILDDMKMPAIWISNAPAEAMDESVRRRFDYSIRFERLTDAQRVAIWRNLVARHSLGDVISEERISSYASRYGTNAGGISNVLSNVKRMDPTPENVDDLVDTLMKPHCELMCIGGPSDGFSPAKDYSLEGLCIKGKVPLDRIVAAASNFYDASYSAASEDSPRMNILLYGPPGTGKTEFVKYLAKRLGRRVMVMRGSDILSKFVGESEQNIADAFRKAEDGRAILFFDEVDGILQDRGNAVRSWEVTQVNEFLQQMEDFDGVMVAATNFSRNLDPATMRRFTFKLEFGYLDDDGKRLFFERMFKTELAPDELAELRMLRNLAPGDFRTVRQEMYYLGGSVTNLDRIAALREECACKKDGAPSGPIGFAASA